jgi:hypothetical protein
MKKILIGVIAISALFLCACKKDKATNPNPLLSSLTVVDAVSDGGPLYVNPYASGLSYATLTDSISYQGYYEYGLPGPGLPLKVVYKSDTTRSIFHGTLSLAPLKIYSLYITGNSSKIDTLLKEESSIPRYTDSAVAVRVINLSIGGPVVNVTLASTPTVNEFSGLKYKQESVFKKYALTSAIASNGFSFNITDAATGAILATYTLPQYSYNYPPTPTTETARFKAITLVISGSINAVPYSANAYSVFLVANY